MCNYSRSSLQCKFIFLNFLRSIYESLSLHRILPSPELFTNDIIMIRKNMRMEKGEGDHNKRGGGDRVRKSGERQKDKEIEGQEEGRKKTFGGKLGIKHKDI